MVLPVDQFTDQRDRHRPLSTDTTPATRDSQSTLQPGDAIQPALARQVDQRTSQSHSTDQQDHQRPLQSYSNHPILALEAFVNDLSDEDARVVPHLFALVRAGHRRSGEHVEDLTMLFAPVREQLNRDWATIEQRARAFAEAENDIFQYEALITDLNDAAAEDARAAFRLIRRNFKSGQQFAELLGDIFRV